MKFKSWKEVSVGGKTPSTRYGQAVGLLGDTFYVFGGGTTGDKNNTTTYLGDMFSLNLSVVPLEWKGIQQEGSLPSPREGASLNPVGDTCYLHGGVDNEDTTTCAEGLFMFTPASSTWERLNATGSLPSAQSSATVVYNKMLVTFGGIINGIAQNCLHSLDVGSLEWTMIEASGCPPPARCDHSLCVIGGKILLTAGSGSDDLWFNDIYLLETVSWQWSKVELKGEVKPSPRDYATLSAVADKYLVQFGGFSGTSGKEECFSDLYCAEFSKTADFEWQYVAIPEESLLPARYAHSTFYHKNELYVFGGQNLEEEFNDLWFISVQVPAGVSFERVPVPKVRYNTSIPIPAPRKVVTPATPAPPKPRDLEELRTNYVKKINELFDTLTERFQQLDMSTATLQSERAAFESEKVAHAELYNKQQQELDEMLKDHRQQNDEWIARMRSDLDDEKRFLAEEKAVVEAARRELAGQQEAFQQKSEKLDAIMRQVQGLK